MTHSYQYIGSLPLTRRKLNARFVHQLKKLVGGKYGIHVWEIFGSEDCGDYTYIFVKDSDNSSAIVDEVKALCKKYGIGSDYIDIYDSEFKQGQYVQVYLSQTKP